MEAVTSKASAAVPSEVEAARTLLDDLPLLKFLSPASRKAVTGKFVPVAFPFGAVILREGDPADAFFVLVSGKARVVKMGERGEEVSLGLLRSGDSFGEMGLLEPSARRQATVRSSSAAIVLRLDRSAFDELLSGDPEIRTCLELHGRYRSLQNLFRLYTPFATLPPSVLGGLLHRFETVSVAAGETVFRQGDGEGPLFAIEEGRLRVFAEEDGQRRNLAYLRKGDVFGEISAFTGEPRKATVEAVTPCRLLSLHPSAFRAITEAYPDFQSAIRRRIAQYDYRREARVPLDFADELLPAEAAVEEVGPDQVDQDADREPHDDTSAEGPAPFATEDGRFVKAPRRIRRFPFIRQIDEMDCGAASLAMVCRHFGRAVSLARIRQLLFTSTDGTSLRAICRGAEELGLAARSVKASARHLDEMPLPAILHWGGNHWVVLYDTNPKEVRLADPGVGLRRLPRAEIEKEWTGYAALFDYTEAFEKAPVGRSSFAWLARFFRPHAGILAKAAGLALIVSVLQMVLPVFSQVIVDRVLVERDEGLLRILLFGMGGVLVFSTAAMVLQRYLLSFAAVRIDASTLDFVTRRLLSLPMSYFSTRKTGDIQRRLTGLRQVREFLVQYGVSSLAALSQLAAVLVLMFVYSPFLAGVFLLTVPLYALLMRYSMRRLRPVFDTLEEAFGKYSAHQIDTIKGIETVKSLGAEGSLRQLMLERFLGLARKQFRADFTVMTYEGAVQAVSFLSIALFLWAGAIQVMRGSLTIGGLVAFNALVALANAPIGILLTTWDHLQYGTVLLDRLNDIFEQKPEQGDDRSALLPVRTLAGRVSLRNVGFRYGGPESPLILDGLTFDVDPGRMVAIVGRSGSGKTTLAKLLSGLLEATEGAILFDGIDMRTLNYRDLRRRVGFVLQENYLFDETIARNIAFGDGEPDLDRVLWAARVASAHEFVERFPLGYDTRVGESGLALSGGQKQRVAIARAIYNRPPILIFDEATSSLDTESERAVKENLDRLLEGRTSFVIAHRLSTIRDADVILVMEKGRLVEQGTHDELMDRKGLYYYLSSQQLGI
jgi:ABC-type bacteriocin/lantibiotic exporter with double-glycine peptidase domain/CRP-like cAMP-binding protein